jgi:membrane protein DedA with SNARE-associated domain/rhodanese-related sulfurtransferase
METLVAQLSNYGLALVCGDIALERLGVPVPALPLLFVAGALAARGQLGFFPLLGVTLATTLTLDFAWYTAGRWRGLAVLRFLCRLALSQESCVRQTEALYHRRGNVSLLFSKFIPGYSIVVLALAGAARVSPLTFLAWDCLGNLLWAGSALTLGYIFHDAVAQMLLAMRRLGLGALIGLGAAVLLYAFLKWWERRRFYKLLRLARITVAELKGLLDGGESPAIVDVRTGPRFHMRHIPGALRMTLDEIDDRLATLPRDREIVLYCTCPNEASAARVARVLIDRGFTRVRPLEGGLDSWIEAGLPVDEETLVTLSGRRPAVF